jgi:acetyl esterase/lipase
MTVLAYILAGIALLMSVPLLVRVKFPQGFMALPLKMFSVALSAVWAVLGAAGALIGWIYRAYWAIPIGIIGAGMMITYIWRSTRSHSGLADAFGADWPDQIGVEQTRHMIQTRWAGFLRMKASPESAVERDVPFWTIPDTDRALLCDLWRPASGTSSGLALIFLHGGAWYFMDKGFMTGPFFNHLVAQGHTVMDVAYRLCPEVDIFEMTGDVKRAIAWMKTNASRYGVNPEKIVLGGGSAGGHLALLAAYTPQHPQLTPEDVRGADLSVRGVVSYYGPPDMLAEYEYTGQERLLNLPPAASGPGTVVDMQNMRADSWRLDTLLGGWPKDALDAYQLASPITHVNPDCPPTLLIQGELDLITPVDATRELHTRLVESGVPAINVVFPWTDHAFDLLLPQMNPAAQSALYDVDRFLALLLNRE